MLEANVIFIFDGANENIQCSKEDKIKDICQKFANKVEKNINSLLFLYGGNQLNLLLNFKDLERDKKTNEIRVLVYTKENDGFICPKCGEKFKFNTEKIDDIMSSINKFKETIDSAKLLIDSIIKASSMNNVNIQLKGVNLILNTINEDIIKTKEKVKNLLDDNQIIKKDEHLIITESEKNKSNENEDDLEEEITKEDFIEHIKVSLNSIQSALERNSLEFIPFIKDKVKKMKINDEEYDYINIDDLNDKLLEINVVLNNLHFSCLCNKYCLPNELRLINVKSFEKGLEENKNGKIEI